MAGSGLVLVLVVCRSPISTATALLIFGLMLNYVVGAMITVLQAERNKTPCSNLCFGAWERLDTVPCHFTWAVRGGDRRRAGTQNHAPRFGHVDTRTLDCAEHGREQPVIAVANRGPRRLAYGRHYGGVWTGRIPWVGDTACRSPADQGAVP